MDTQPSKPVTREKPIPAARRRRVGVFLLAGFIGLGLGVIGGIAAGFIGFLVGGALYPSLEMGILALLLGPMMVFPIAGLCTGLVTAAQRSVERGAVVGALLFGGSQLVLYVPSMADLWIVVALFVVVAAVVGGLIGAGAAALSVGWSTPKNAALETGK
jgi:hypothetical protein